MLVDVVGFDPSLRNWGMSRASLNTETGELTVTETAIIKTKALKCKKTRQNAKDIMSASELFLGLKSFIKTSDIICIEVPHGSQSSRAMVSYGVCIGIIGILATHYKKIVQVSANDVKKIVRTDPKHTPSKLDVINWVKSKHPEAPLPTTLSAEHVCDSIVAIHAALDTKQFKDYLP